MMNVFQSASPAVADWQDLEIGCAILVSVLALTVDKPSFSCFTCFIFHLFHLFHVDLDLVLFV
jgi:hypothetical protein